MKILSIGTEVFIIPKRFDENISNEGTKGIIKSVDQITDDYVIYTVDIYGSDYIINSQVYNIEEHLVKEQWADQYMTKYGFHLTSFSGNHAVRVYNDNHIGVIINIRENSFTLVYNIPKSIAQVKIGSCSPFYDLPEQDKEYLQFEKMLNQMKSIVNRLEI